MTENSIPVNNSHGNNEAFCSLILGLFSITNACISPFSSIIGGTIGIICASFAKRNNYAGSPQKAGMICSICGLAFGCLVIASWTFLIGSLITIGSIDELVSLFQNGIDSL